MARDQFNNGESGDVCGPAAVASQSNHVFLASDSSPWRYRFQGYAFAGCDFIQGPMGLDLYQSETGSEISPGLDGCYFIARPIENCLEVGTDFSGNYKLFIYERLNFWALSSSLIWLAREIKSRKLPLSLNRPQLEAWKLGKGPFSNQLTSFETVFQEVRLVPSWLKIIASRRGLKFVSRPYPSDELGSYQERLSRYLSLWASRLRTLCDSSDLQLSVDLSGGLDSRVVFAFFLHLLKVGALSTNRISINTSKSELLHADRVAADRVLKYLDIERVENSLRREKIKIGADEAFNLWRLTSLGQYSPFQRIPSDKQNPDFLKIGGGGGEEYRLFYKNFKGTLQKSANGFTSALVKLRYRWSVRSTLNTLRDSYGKETDVSILHYREFRSRFHSGTRAFSGGRILPLKGVDLRACAAAMAPDLLENRQLLFDLLNSLEPGLLEVPFDTPEKAPSSQNLNDLSRGAVVVENFGKVYRAPSGAPTPRRKGSAATAFDIIVDRIEARRGDLPTRVASQSLIEEAIEDCKRARQSGFPKQRESSNVHYILLCIELLDLGLLQR